MIALLLLLASFAFASSSECPDAVKEPGCLNVKNEVECCICEDVLFIVLDGCANLIIDWDNLNITLQLTLNGVVLFESTFGFDSAPALCTDIWGLHICLKLDDLVLKDWVLTGCLYLTVDSIEIPMGCFSTEKPDEVATA